MRRHDMWLIVSAGIGLWGVWMFSARAAFIVCSAMIIAAWWFFIDEVDE